MGTSQSSSGAPSGVPLVPPWVPDLEPTTPGEPTDDSGQGDPPSGLPDRPAPVAPPARFGPTRRRISSFARTGRNSDLRSGLGHYVRTGLGGSKTATRRLGGTVQNARNLYTALSSVAQGKPPTLGSVLDPEELAGASADRVLDAVVEAVRPVDGTLDAEASRRAIQDALSDLLTRFPEADLLNLSEQERLFATERYISMDVYNRVRLDLGKTIQNNAPSAKAGLSRLREVKDYIKETVSATFRSLKEVGRKLTSGKVGEMVRDVLQETLMVFEQEGS